MIIQQSKMNKCANAWITFYHSWLSLFIPDRPNKKQETKDLYVDGDRRKENE